MKPGERKPTLIAMSRTIVELADDLQRSESDVSRQMEGYEKFREDAIDSKNALHLSENAREGLKVDIHQLNNKLTAADTLSIKLQGQLDSMAPPDAMTRPDQPLEAPTVASHKIEELTAVITQIRDAIPETFTDGESRIKTKSGRACQKIWKICEEALS